MTEPTWAIEQEDNEQITDTTRNDRFSNMLVVVVTVIALLIGLGQRQRYLNQHWAYTSRAYGLEAVYPAGWIVDEGDEYVVRIRDPRARPFKTQYQIAVLPAGEQASIRNVIDGLTIQRSTELPAYRVLTIDDTNYGGGMVTQIDFVFVESDPNPFIQHLPVVVLGRDIVLRDGDRAIIVTYMAEESDFDIHLSGFHRFFNSLQY